MRYLVSVLMLFGLAGCVETTSSGPVSQNQSVSSATGSATFRSVVRRMEPVAEAECRRRAPGQNCDFQIVVDPRADLPPNAYQTLNRNGRPIIGFTQALIADARNADELAFIFGHEAAHHIENHIAEQQSNAIGGAVVGSVIAATLGLDVGVGQRVGGTVGARAYSKPAELEADALGTIITHRAGFDPVRGAEFFNRIPDPGDRFLGTHPPNADRIATVRRVASQL